jgi:hypothetical protein
MSDSNPLIVRVDPGGAEPYQLGDEIWRQLGGLIRPEVESLADHAGADLVTMSRAHGPGPQGQPPRRRDAALFQRIGPTAPGA